MSNTPQVCVSTSVLAKPCWLRLISLIMKCKAWRRW